MQPQAPLYRERARGVKYEVTTQVTISMRMEIEAPSPEKAESAAFDALSSALVSVSNEWRYECIEDTAATPIP